MGPIDVSLAGTYSQICNLPRAMRRGKASRLASTQAARSAKQHANRCQPRRRTQNPRLQNDSDPLLDTKKMTGELPPFNDLGHFVVDNVNQKIYTYGGYRPDDDTPTADFFTCDMGTLKWKNLTHSLRFDHPYDPFSQDGIKPQQCELPRLHCAASTFLHLNGGNFVLLFGGHNGAKDRVTSDLIAIDVDTLRWWYVKVHGGPVNDRIHHSLVAIDNRIYIFGGKREFDAQAPCHASYSIAEYSLDKGVWSWVVCDHPYPAHVPSLGHGGTAMAVYDGKKVLLTPGRLGKSSSTIDLSSEKLVFFHTENHTFHVPAQNSGELPHEVSWYQSFPVTPSLHMYSRSPRKAGPKISTCSTPSPFVIFCTWIPRPDEYVALELWKYFVPPEEKISCLQLQERLWDLDLDLQIFVVVGSRFFLLGSEPSGAARPEDAKVNICTEIVLAVTGAS